MLWGVVILIILYKMVLEEPSGPPEKVKHIYPIASFMDYP